MRVPFALLLAWREGRASVRQIGIYMASITLGVGALVAIHSFRADVARAVDRESRSILGADLRLSASTPLPDSAQRVVDSLVTTGAQAARVTNLVSMVLAERTEATRLVQVRAVEPGYPFYGAVTSNPPGAWAELTRGGGALVDEAVLVQLGARAGDTIAVGNARFPVRGTVSGLPTDIGFQAAVGPRVYLAAQDLDATGLVTFGSLARYLTYIRLPAGMDVDVGAIEDRYRPLFRDLSVGSTTYVEQAEELTEATRILGRFLGLIGLTALLLGGIGVASAIHVFVRGKVESVAVLRCLGARQRTAFFAYTVQAASLGLLGAVLGAILGVAIQRILPASVADLLPVTVVPRTQVWIIVLGVAIGSWVSLVFAFIPLLSVRDVPPLAALRRGYDKERRRLDPVRTAAYGLLLASMAGLSLWQAPSLGLGIGFSVALGMTLLVLWGTAHALIKGTRRLFPSRARYPVRQGVANLFRPRNQTVAVTLALGFGVFLISSILLVQHNLQNQLSFDAGAEQPNLLLFDIQEDQEDSITTIVRRVSASEVDLTPLVIARIAAINDAPVGELLADSSDARPARWAIRRTYRNTYRAELKDSEQLVDGAWWDARNAPPANLPGRISLEADLADDLRVGVGDRITWDVQGLEVETEIASLRRVDWARFDTNFFVVFEPGVLEDAPRTFLALARVPEPERRAELQRDLVRAYPNVSVLDLALVQEVLDRILGTVAGAIRFLAGFAVMAGMLVLVGALATSRYQRMRESALLRTLGARRRQIVSILSTEYLALGMLAGSAGVLLGAAAAWGMMRFVFEGSFMLPWGSTTLLWLLTAAVTTLIGMLGSRGVVDRPPLAVLREITE